MRHTLTLAMILLTTGCMSFNDDHFDGVEASLRAQMPDIHLEKEMAIGFGSGIFDLVDLADTSPANLSEIDHLRIAVYQVTALRGQKVFADAVFDRALREQGADLEWERIVRVRDDDEQVWVFAGLNTRQQILEAISVFVLDQNELVMMNLDGDLSELIDYALATGNDRRRKAS